MCCYTERMWKSWIIIVERNPCGEECKFSCTYRCRSDHQSASGSLRCTHSDKSPGCWHTSAGILRWAPHTRSNLSTQICNAYVFPIYMYVYLYTFMRRAWTNIDKENSSEGLNVSTGQLKTTSGQIEMSACLKYQIYKHDSDECGPATSPHKQFKS